MPKKFINQVTLLILVNVIVKLIWIFGVERAVQLKVGFENYGLYFSLFNFTLILSVINDPGLSNYLIRLIAGENQSENEISALFSLKLFLSFIYLIFTFLVALISGYSLSQLLIFLLLYQILWGFQVYLRAFLRGHQHRNAEIFFSILDKLLLIVLLIPLLWFSPAFKWSISFYVIAQLGSLVISILFSAIYLHKDKINIGVGVFKSIDFKILRKIFPFALFAFLVLAYNKIDGVLLVKLLPNGKLETGIYAAAYRFFDASSMLPILFATFFYPLIVKSFTLKEDINPKVAAGLSILIPISIIIATVSWFYQAELMTLFYGNQNSRALFKIFGVLMLSMPLVVLYYVFSTVLTAMGKLKVLNYISGFGLVVNVFLNLLLVPNLGALGAAIATFISLLLIGLVYLIYYYTFLKYSFDILFWIKLLSFILLLVLLIFLIQKMMIFWMMEIAIFIVNAGLLVFIFKLNKIKVLNIGRL